MSQLRLKKRNERKTERKIQIRKRRKLRDSTQLKNNNNNNNNYHHNNNGSDNNNNNNNNNNNSDNNNKNDNNSNNTDNSNNDNNDHIRLKISFLIIIKKTISLSPARALKNFEGVLSLNGKAHSSIPLSLYRRALQVYPQGSYIFGG